MCSQLMSLFRLPFFAINHRWHLPVVCTFHSSGQGGGTCVEFDKTQPDKNVKTNDVDDIIQKTMLEKIREYQQKQGKLAKGKTMVEPGERTKNLLKFEMDQVKRSFDVRRQVVNIVTRYCYSCLESLFYVHR